MGPGTVPKSQKASIHQIDPFFFVLLYVLQILKGQLRGSGQRCWQSNPFTGAAGITSAQHLLYQDVVS